MRWMVCLLTLWIACGSTAVASGEEEPKAVTRAKEFLHGRRHAIMVFAYPRGKLDDMEFTRYDPTNSRSTEGTSAYRVGYYLKFSQGEANHRVPVSFYVDDQGNFQRLFMATSPNSRIPPPFAHADGPVRYAKDWRAKNPDLINSAELKRLIDNEDARSLLSFYLKQEQKPVIAANRPPDKAAPRDPAPQPNRPAEPEGVRKGRQLVERYQHTILNFAQPRAILEDLTLVRCLRSSSATSTIAFILSYRIKYKRGEDSHYVTINFYVDDKGRYQRFATNHNAADGPAPFQIADAPVRYMKSWRNSQDSARNDPELDRLLEKEDVRGLLDYFLRHNQPKP